MGDGDRPRGPIEYVKAAYARPDEVSYWPVAIGISVIVVVVASLIGPGFAVGFVAAVLYLGLIALRQWWRGRRRPAR
jgi:Flp pilus assembly protein TadB